MTYYLLQDNLLWDNLFLDNLPWYDIDLTQAELRTQQHRWRHDRGTGSLNPATARSQAQSARSGNPKEATDGSALPRTQWHKPCVDDHKGIIIDDTSLAEHAITSTETPMSYQDIHSTPPRP
ncbi:hypothetical protein INS49_002744 [Diaporthe citri]|uniref:uncharacterized protein n=1 Tax=Diaporthe citri TaxID=83186 RepID=UPI001C7F9816|nr:uncharacterized protein INS49_002744 [Diaporthe citri]KAG6368533.1 hypothetical protein INS49_002744 [Diaporthe citri]